MTGIEYWSPLDKKELNVDFGLIGRCTEDLPKRRVFFFWGIHGMGTVAGVHSSLSSDISRDIVHKMGNEDFSAIVQAPFSENREIGKVTLVAPPYCCQINRK